MMIKGRIPLYIQTKEYIVGLIERGEYKPGSQLPTEKDLMEKLKVGRATVRAALSELEREGTVIKRHGSGTFVAVPHKTYSFEPLISLSFSLKKMGIELKNKTLLTEKTVAQGELLSGWQHGTELGHIKRVRTSGGIPIAIEDSFYTPDLFEIVSKASPTESVAHVILEGSAENVGRVLMEVIIRQPTDEERYIVEIDSDERVANMKRWIYAEDKKKPVNYVSVVVPLKFLK